MRFIEKYEGEKHYIFDLTRSEIETILSWHNYMPKNQESTEKEHEILKTLEAHLYDDSPKPQISQMEKDVKEMLKRDLNQWENRKGIK